MEKSPKDLWKVDNYKYQVHVTISAIDSTTKSESADEKVVYMDDLEKRKQVYGICGECNEPATGEKWCQPCNAKRFKNNFKNWTSGNKVIDEFIQQAQLNAVHYFKCLEWIPFEKFQNVTYITRGGFGKIYSAKWPEGYIDCWDIRNQRWSRYINKKVALKSLDNSSDICSDFLNEIKSYLQIHVDYIALYYGITQDPNTKEYMMILEYYKYGNLRNYLNKSEDYIDYKSKIDKLQRIAKGLLDIHNAGKVHKDFHSGNILHGYSYPFISDLGMCQSANKNNKQLAKEEGIYGVLPYMAPEILCGYQYKKAADIYSFGIIINEFISEKIPYSNISHDYILAIKICKGFRPKISKNIPKLLANLIVKCWDAKAENRPTAKELYQILNKWNNEIKNNKMYDYDNEYSEYSEDDENNENSENSEDNEDSEYSNDDENNENSKNNKNNEDRKNSKTNEIENNKGIEIEDIKYSEIYSQIKECDKICKSKFKNRLNEHKSKNIQIHPQAVYTSRLLSFKNLPEPVNSSDLLFFQLNSENPISECLDTQLSESDLNEIYQDDNKNNNE